MSEELELIGTQQLEIEKLKRKLILAEASERSARKAENFARNDAETAVDQIHAFIPKDIDYGNCLKDRIEGMVEEIQKSRNH